VNAVGRLWRAVEARDWRSAAMQLHPNVTIERPHEARRYTRSEDYVAAWKATPEDQVVTVSEFLSEHKIVAVLARIDRGADVLHCAAFYELQDGRIARGTEVWSAQA